MNDEKVTFKCVIEELEKERDCLSEINKVLVEGLETLKVAVNDKVNDPGATLFIEWLLAKAKEMGK